MYLFLSTSSTTSICLDSEYNRSKYCVTWELGFSFRAISIFNQSGFPHIKINIIFYGQSLTVFSDIHVLRFFFLVQVWQFARKLHLIGNFHKLAQIYFIVLLKTPQLTKVLTLPLPLPQLWLTSMFYNINTNRYGKTFWRQCMYNEKLP